MERPRFGNERDVVRPLSHGDGRRGTYSRACCVSLSFFVCCLACFEPAPQAHVRVWCCMRKLLSDRHGTNTAANGNEKGAHERRKGVPQTMFIRRCSQCHYSSDSTTVAPAPLQRTTIQETITPRPSPRATRHTLTHVAQVFPFLLLFRSRQNSKKKERE